MTTREKVAALLLRGMSDKMMAREIGLSEAAIGYHIGMIIARTGSRNRTEAALRLARKGAS